MNRERIRPAVYEIINQIAPEIDSFDDSHDLKQDLGIDSAQFVYLVLELEEHFEIEIADRDVFRLKSVGSCIEFLTERVIR